MGCAPSTSMARDGDRSRLSVSRSVGGATVDEHEAVSHGGSNGRNALVESATTRNTVSSRHGLIGMATDSRNGAGGRATAAAYLDRRSVSQKYEFIPDNYSSLEQVTAAIREAGLESSNLIVGVDFTKSNEWTGKNSFGGKSLHATDSGTSNPYAQAIAIIGKTLAPFDDDNLIPCFGFGDATTHDQAVFSFHSDHRPCHGFEEVLQCYRQISRDLKLSGPTSFAPVIEAATDIVERSGGKYHVLVIVADGQVTKSIDTRPGSLSPQEEKTIKAIALASSYALSIILVRVGDGPWDDMKGFDDKIPARVFDNFQKSCWGMEVLLKKKQALHLRRSWRFPFSTELLWSLAFWAM